MSNFRKLLKSEYSTEYSKEYGMKEPLYTGPFIYCGGGPLFDATGKPCGKLFDEKGYPIRWYAYYNFKNPISGKMERMTPIYDRLHRSKTLHERSKAAKVLLKAIRNILENGYNPYTDEQLEFDENRTFTTSEAIQYVLELKKQKLKEVSYSDFKVRINRFEKFLLANGYAGKNVNEVNKKVVSAYLNFVLLKTSASNRNNERAAISGFFGQLAADEIIPINFVQHIGIESSEPKRNKSFTPAQESNLYEKLQQFPILLLFVQIVSFGMLREVEACRLKIKDIDVANAKMYLETKTKAVKTKIIPKILLDKLPDLSKMDPESFLISRNGFGTHWEANESSRRGFMGKWFGTIKAEINLGEEYTVKSYRHTHITEIYRSLRQIYSPFEAKSNLMLITGHATMKALERYLRDIDAELPEDFSKHFDNTTDM